MYLETERLIITEFEEDMAEALYLGSNDEDMYKYLEDEVWENTEDASRIIRMLKSAYESSKGPFVYPVILKDKTLIGYVEAVKLNNGDFEVGYHIFRNYTHKGYAKEALRSFIPYIMNKLDIVKIYGITLRRNAASMKVLEGTGFIREYEGISRYHHRDEEICRYVYYMSAKDVVNKFFMDGYNNHNYRFIERCLKEDYFDHSPASARSNKDAIGILKIVEGQFNDLKVTVLDIFKEDEMVATRVLYEGHQTGECMGIKATGRFISFEALENFRVHNGVITESWGYWPDKEIEAKLKG